MGACGSCGIENRDGARFCDACGAPLGAVSEAASPVRKTVTILFADVSGSTGLGERLDPEALRALMARFFGIARRVVERHGGTVEKYIGDAVMAVFGIPTVHEDDALRAVRAAKELDEGVRGLAVEVRRDHGVELAIRTGVDTGQVAVGDPSTGGTLATGDAVNIAARLQQGAAPGEILIGGATLRLVRDSVEVEPIGELLLRGHAEPLAAFRLLAVDRTSPTPARRLDVPIVGRERELALLARVFDEVVVDRRIHLFTLLGPPGVGKSRLARQFLSSSPVVSAATMLLRGRSLPYGEGLTYWALREAIARWAGIEEGDPVESARDRLHTLIAGHPDVTSVEPRVAELLGLESAVSPAEELTWAVRSLFESMADTAPVMLVLDDLQWADPPLLDLVEHVVDFGRDVPILVLCLARPDLLDARPGWAGGKLNATTLLLEPLPTADAAELAGRLLGGGLPDAVAMRIAEAAEGNPLFVEEFAGMLADDGLLERDGGTWIARADLTSIAVPPTIQALLAARLDRLPPGERAVAGRASIVGRVFEAGAVVALSPEPERGAVPDRLGSLVRKEVVRPDRPGLDGQAAYRFRHLLIRDAAYEGLSKLDRAALHERFADWLLGVTEERSGEYEEILGYHLEQAYRYRVELGSVDEHARGLAERAAAHLGAAGKRAAERGDAGAARTMLRTALELSRVGATVDVTTRLAIDLAYALVEGGDWDNARAALEELPPGAHVDPLTAARSRFLTLSALANSDPTTLFETIDQGMAELAATFERLGDDLDRMKVLRMRGFTMFVRGRAAEATALLGDAVEIGRRSGSWLWIELASWIALFDAFGPRPASEVVARAEAMLEMAAGHPGLTAILRLGLGAGRVAMGEDKRGFDDLAAGTERLGQLGRTVWQGGGLQLAGYMRLCAGDHEAAERVLREADQVLAGLRETGFRSSTDVLLGKVLIEAGRPEESRPWVELGRSLAAPDDFLTQSLWRSASARLASLSGDQLGALDLAREAVAIAQTSDYLGLTADALLDLAEVERAAGQPDAAEASTRAALELYRRKEDRFGQRRAEAALALAG